jgi:hypothetical protein
MVSKNLHVDEILGQIHEIQKLQKLQLVIEKFWIHYKNLTM